MDKSFLIKTLREAGEAFDVSARAESKDYAEIALGMEQLCEAIGRTIDDTTRSHAPIIFDAAHRRFLRIATGDFGRNTISPTLYFGQGCSLLSGALDYYFFDRWPKLLY